MKYIVGNWKMNLRSKEVVKLSLEISRFLEQNTQNNNVVIICPAFTSLSLVYNTINHINLTLGAQDCSALEQGAHTGDVSADMLYDTGCKYVIVGHSERRQNHNETSEIIKHKAESVYKHNMQPIICIGESLEQKEAGKTFDVLALQLEESVPKIDKPYDLIVAYEPVWAIGSGLQPQEVEIKKVGKFIRDLVYKKFTLTKRVKVLYGGSVNENNCYNIVNLENIDGLLIGGASLKSKSFINIIMKCNEVK